MDIQSDGIGTRACWFVGASFDKVNDQTPRFYSEGIWVNDNQDKYLEQVKSIQPGDRIAIKSTYTRKKDLPFDNLGQSVSVMAIKAIGIVTENNGDGHNLKVNWTPFDQPREWYFFTHRATVWKVIPGEWMPDALINFTFERKVQDINRFRNDPYWQERFGDQALNKHRFKWTAFYEAVADKLLNFKNNRKPLIAEIHEIASHVEGVSNLQDQFSDDSKGPLQDICPFTVFGIFNRGIKDTNRKKIATELAKLLGVNIPVPQSFEGIPLVNNQRSWFFNYAKDRNPDDIDKLWEMFEISLIFADEGGEELRQNFITSFHITTHLWGIGWNLSMGLYWIRPWHYPTLDERSRIYIKKKLNVQFGQNGPDKRCDAYDYMMLRDALDTRFHEEKYPVHSFPELSFEAWHFKDTVQSIPKLTFLQNEKNKESEEDIPETLPSAPYSIDTILENGCFLDRSKLEIILERLRTNKNIILQGPPGTGKTWLAKKLAFALMGQRDDSRLRAVQFHPNLSYEDFIRGWRPAGEGKLALIDGPFLEMVHSAKQNPSEKYVIVIEEINRGNPAQIFGEMLTLLEKDKRTPDEALELSYRKEEGEHVYIPDNMFVIGTMNIADRSLALVDFALRRRFAFIELEPTFGKSWQDWVHTQCHIDLGILDEIEKRILSLNEDICTDANLGPQFRIGHSYVTPSFKISIEDARQWFRQVVYTEIGPMLDEYWFDALEKAQKARDRLLDGF